ncbi:NupC/NupG family nucleoside CNT transporter [bacterium]|nr:NupC/NupG family nucleoside CNT transporter [bacterium]MBT4577786.1 NupC/NupG family nucleoside CNT transporter [bacterium]MBT6528952.1 NupC/NupG family nucleoside CNT transporter [bacterium]
MLQAITTYLTTYNRYMNLLGIPVVLGLAYLLSNNRRKINVRLVISALIMQVILAFVVIRTEIGRSTISFLADAANALYLSATDGITFLFGNLANPSGPWGFVFAFNVLPIIVFFGAFMALLFHFGIIQRAVSLVRIVIQPLFGTSGAETLCAISNSFLGQTEAPLLIRHYLDGMTKSELFVVMVSGMGTLSGAILLVYASMGVPVSHLLGASIMAIPATILLAKIMLPETGKPKTLASGTISMKSPSKNMLDAISTGTSDGLQLALNVGAMLIAFIALLALGDSIVVGLQNLFYWLFSFSVHPPVYHLKDIFAVLFLPFGYLLGFTGNEAWIASKLIGIKVIINEMVAYSQLVKEQVSPRALTLLTYVLCGFSNLSCIGIQIGGIGALVPSKRAWLSELGLRAVVAATLANFLSALVVGLIT